MMCLLGLCLVGQREGPVDEKDPIVPKLREMLFLKHIIRCAARPLSREAAVCRRSSCQHIV